jgi:hypothetical protein
MHGVEEIKARANAEASFFGQASFSFVRRSHQLPPTALVSPGASAAIRRED